MIISGVRSPLSQLISLFRQREALSVDKATEITKLDLMECGWILPNQNFEKIYPFFIKNVDGKYWLDESKIDKYYEGIGKLNNKIVIGIVIFFGVFFWMAIVFGLFN